MLWYNIVALIWSMITIYAGIRSAEGITSGPLSAYGSAFDYIFGLDSCARVPHKNQEADYLRDPYNACAPQYQVSYPHGYDTIANKQVMGVLPPKNDTEESTAVIGVGGVNSSYVQGWNKKAMQASQYILGYFTGSFSGSVTNGQYDTKRFKSGTPYSQQSYDASSNTIGYYYWTDRSGQEVPIIAPCGTGNANSSGTYLPQNLNKFNNGLGNYALPAGWNAIINSGANAVPTEVPVTCDPGGGYGVYSGPFGIIQPYYNPMSNITWSDRAGFANQGGNYNAMYTNSVLAGGISKLKFKEFTTTGPETPPSGWARQL